ncbi:MAG TPA: glycosyltransferase [Bacillota bacterium]|nr:glycosyltransferase [Bacillota bacterium]
MFADKTVVFFSAVPWNGLYARPQQISHRLVSRGARVLFVEPPWTYLSPIRRPELFSTWWKSERLHVLSHSLAVYTPHPMLPGANLARPINRMNQRSLHAEVRNAAEKLGWSVDLLWSHLPGTADWPADTPILYECVDNHVAFGGLSRAEAVVAMEDALLKRANSVFATSGSLLARCRTVRPDTCLVPNGADYEHFASAGGKPMGKAVWVGFYGGIGAWLDLQLVFATARLMPDARFTMLGPVEPGAELGGAPGNIEFPGLKPYHELPAMLAQFDVVMIPFKVSTLTEAVNPIKLYEYFAAGKPTVVTALPELVKFSPLVYVVSNPEEFRAGITAALHESTELVEQRKSVARAASWDARLDEIERHSGGELFG